MKNKGIISNFNEIVNELSIIRKAITPGQFVNDEWFRIQVGFIKDIYREYFKSKKNEHLI